MPTVSSRRLKLICFGCLAISFHASCRAQDVISVTDLTGARERAKTVIDSVSPAIVTFAYGKEPKFQFGCGAIVTPDGHVVISGPVHAVVDDDLLDLRLVDGRRVGGKALGWSSEFGFGMLKITDSGPWPHVDRSDRAKAGEVCVALGYPRGSSGDFKARRPDVRLGVITKSADGQWLTTSYRSEFNAHPVFNLNGELLGLNCSSPVGGDPLVAGVKLISAHWEELVAGNNLDRIRLSSKEPEQRRSTKSLPEAEKVAETVIARAKAASVRMSDLGAKDSFASGVIVTPDGYVITCGHHGRMPGAKMTLLLHDGRSVSAIVLGTNLVSDVGVLKIADEGTWPHVEMGRSSTTQFGDHCVLIGYPTRTPGPEPSVFRTQIVKSTQTLPRRDEWYSEFWTGEYPESIGGASGGGVFDAQGRVIGVLRGGVGKEMNHSRVELFRKNWNMLTANKRVDEVDTKVLTEATASLNAIAKELRADEQP